MKKKTKKKTGGQTVSVNFEIIDLQNAVAHRDRLLAGQSAEIGRFREAWEAANKEAQLQSKRVKFLLDRVAALEVTVLTLSRVMTESRTAAAEMVYGLNLSSMPSVLTQKPAAPKAQG